MQIHLPKNSEGAKLLKPTQVPHGYAYVFIIYGWLDYI